MIRIVIFMITLLLQLTGTCDINSCLPWSYDKDSLRLMCRTEGSRTIRLIDNHGLDAARCAFNESSGNCSSLNFVKSIIRNKLVTFRVDRNLKTDINGNWSCLQQNKTFIANVLTSGDLTVSTIVNMFGKIVEDGDVQRLLLTCSSCRITKGMHVEFHINNSSEEIITFNNETGKCTSLHGDCTSSKCNCSASGNTFSLFLLSKKKEKTNANFSCEMKFEDKAQSVVFVKVPTLSFNGKEFKYRGTRTVKTEITDVHNLPRDTENNTVGKVIAGISTIIGLAILTVTVYSYCKRRRPEKKMKHDEDNHLTCLLDSNNSKENKSVCTDSKNKMKSLFSEFTDEITEAETRLTIQQSQIETIFMNHGEAQRTCPGLFETSIMNHGEAQRTCPGLFESALIELNKLKTSVNEIEASLKTFHEILTTITSVIQEMESKKDSINVNVEMNCDGHVETIYLRDTTDYMYVQRSETQQRRLINMGVSKTHSQLDDMFDVLFINFETQSEINWVIKALNVLENEYNLHCGCAKFGYDDCNYFKDISESTIIIMTFTEQSSKRKPAILSVIDYLQLVVAVMVEHCSIPIQHPKMKCVDATKDEKEWLDQLSTALKLRQRKSNKVTESRSTVV